MILTSKYNNHHLDERVRKLIKYHYYNKMCILKYCNWLQKNGQQRTIIEKWKGAGLTVLVELVVR